MAEVQKWTVTEPFVDLPGRLLEGPYYDESTNQLRFIDILQEKLHFVDLAKGPESLKTLDTNGPLGVTANIASSSSNNDEIVVGAKYGYATLNLKSGKLEYIRKVWPQSDGPEKFERMRGNDGAVDSRGRFWLGMMTDLKLAELRNEGVLFRLDPDLSLHPMIEDMGISNGLGWNKDETIMYVTDTVTGNIFAYDFDVDKGKISNRRVFYSAPEGTPPDGFAMDEEGHLWIALWAGSKVVRVSPEGKVVGEISLPARCISCAEFVGTDLYITTADVEPTADPYGGKLYKVNVGIRGKPRHNFKLQTAAA